MGCRVDPAFFKISHTVDVATFHPSPTSSPWILRYSHESFSRARHSARAHRDPGLALRPGRRGG